ncbi:AAA family ATPase [Candidatus Woesearchaeota archaeon]|nr:AAA family ATPase [Candidatus Woesearchaeota archaeon]
MSIMKDMLGANESLFKNEIALDYSFIPKLIPFREKEQRHVAFCLKPLFQARTGKNVGIYGPPGVGKTVACRHLFNEIGEESEDISPLYVNCWQRNTSFKIMLELCEQLGYKLTHNKRTDELFAVVKGILNKDKKALAVVFDEIDKVEDFDFLYMMLEELYRKSLVLITNYKSWFDELDERIKSRLAMDGVEFKPYNPAETKAILKQRMDYAFVPGVWDEDAFELIAQKTAQLEDIRSGLHLMKEAALLAENQSSRKVTKDHAQEALRKIDTFNLRRSSDLTDDERSILDIVKKHTGQKIGDLFKLYTDLGGNSVYKTFQRKIKKLEAEKFVTLEKSAGGKEGNTTLVSYKDIAKKLTDY